MFGVCFSGSAQEKTAVEQFLEKPLEFHGNFLINSQVYNEDTLIGAPNVPERFRMNALSNLLITKGNFSAGLRYEAYQKPLLGFDMRYEGQGLPYKFVKYNNDGLEVTVGNFYEQFGTGMIIRAYEVADLGVDNVYDGARAKYTTANKAVEVTGLVGRQRYFWQLSPGLVRAGDINITINDLVEAWREKELRLKIGGTFASKFQEDKDPALVLPENVGAGGGRLSLMYKNFSFLGEYVMKSQDPSFDNGYLYRQGQGLFLNMSYAQKGFGVNLSAKTIDDMSFRSDRNESINNLLINYHPALTMQHAYNLAATLYPYASQPNGEVAFQGDITYKIPRNTWLGGKYGTTIIFNYADVFGLDTTHVNDLATERKGYKTKFFSPGQGEFFRDINAMVDRKINKTFKVKLMYINLLFDNTIMKLNNWNGKIYSDIAIVDFTTKINDRHSIRTELQGLWTNQDQGDWAFALIEYTYSPHWFFTVLNQFNYGNANEQRRIHYPYVSTGYTYKSSRIMIGYGLQRAGVFCVGGVCRVVPASNGFSIMVSSTF